MRCLAIFSVFASLILAPVAYAQSFSISPKVIETSHFAAPSFDITRSDDDVIDHISIGRCSYDVSPATPQNFALGIMVQDGALDDILYDYPVCITDGATGDKHCSILRYNPDAPSVGNSPSDIGMYLFKDCRNTDRIYIPLLNVSSQ